VDVNYLLTGISAQVKTNTSEIQKLKAEIYDLRVIVNELSEKK
jgi:hypothetical protein